MLKAHLLTLKFPFSSVQPAFLLALRFLLKRMVNGVLDK